MSNVKNLVDFNLLEFNLYELLNVSIDASYEEIKKQFRTLIKLFHPDKITKTEEHIYYNMTIANNILTNPDQRKKYDEWLLKSHKSHSALKDNFKQELVEVQQYFPETKEDAQNEFQKNFDLLAKRHGDYKEDTRALQAIYKDKEKERSNVKIERENFSDMDEFNTTFKERKKKGIYATSIVKRETEIQPFTFSSNKYAELKHTHNIYVKDTQLKYAFELIPVDESKISKKTTKEAINEYNNQSVEFTKGNIKNRINNLDF